MNQSKTKKRNSQKKYDRLIDIFRIRKGIHIVYKILYISIVFVGFNLVWYGVYTTISSHWPLNIPIVAIVLGVSMLYVTGKIRDLT